MKTSFIPSQALRVPYNETYSVQHLIKDILERATQLGRNPEGTTYDGVVMAHLVRAQLELSLNIKLDKSKIFSGDKRKFCF